MGIETEENPEHKWQFIDREKLEELDLNWFDLKARGYENVLVRFHSVDPLPDEGDQEGLSTYQYSANNPILLSDPNGDCPKCWWESVKNWFNAPISPLAQETGKAYMQSRYKAHCLY